MKRLLPLILLTACAAPLAEAAPPNRVEAECALLAEAGAAMAAAGTPAHPGLLEGCPGITARDSRALPDQMASLRVASAAPLPPGLAARSRADTVFRRMITRGVPVTIATVLSASDVFRQTGH